VRRIPVVIAVSAALVAVVSAGTATGAPAPKTTSIVSSGSIAVPSEPAPVAGPQGSDELRPGTIDVEAPVSDSRGVGHQTAASGPAGTGGSAADPALALSFDGLNFFQQRFANNGNQFSVEPPDQGLCVGNNKVVEIVNSVYRVYDMHGRPLINPVAARTGDAAQLALGRISP
jgi:hypothetical protein